MGASVGRESDEETGGKRSVEASGSNSIAAGGDIGNAFTGAVNNGILIQANRIGGLTENQVEGDHVDFRDATFHDKVVAAEHHYHGDVPAPAEWQSVGEVEPLEFGVSPTRHIPGQPDVPPYVPRDCDGDLRAKLAHSGLVLVLGERYAGKSYTAWHAVRSLEGYRLYTPDRGEDLRAVLTALQGKRGKYVIWLDELTEYLGEEGLDRKLLGRLAGLGAVLLGTMRPGEYYRRRTGNDPGDRVLATARTVQLPREWSDAELRRLAELDDPRAYPAFMWSGKEGAASYFAIGHTMFDEWQRSGTKEDHPRGQLLVRAAVDLARCGVTGAVPTELLRQVQEQYGTEERESFEDALTWATTPMFGVSGLLVAGERHRTWRAYGALVAEALRSEDLEPVPDGVWWLLLDAAEGGAPIDRRAVLDAARAALQPRIEAGDTDLMFALADRVGGDEREDLIRRAAESGHREAAEEWAAHLMDAGDEATALRYLEIAAEGGSVSAAREAGRLHRESAERWLRMAAEGGDGDAAHRLGDMLLGTRLTEALRWYVRAVDAGHDAVAGSIGRLMDYWDADDEAEFWLRRGVALGDPGAMNSLGAFLHSRGRDTDEQEQLYRRAMDGGHDTARRNLGDLLVTRGAAEEGLELLRLSAAGGSGEAAYWLWQHLTMRGETEEADMWLRRSAELHNYYAKRQLGELPITRLDPPDTVDE